VKNQLKVESVFEDSFREFGQILDGYDFTEAVSALRQLPKPDGEVVYVPSEPRLEATAVFRELSLRHFGGMPVQLGYCNGWNTKLNGLEYHRDSEVNIAATDVIVLLGRQADIDRKNFTYDTSLVKAFLVPSGTAVEFFATTLHYAPCSADKGGFRVGCALPRGTNGPKPDLVPGCKEDKLLAAANKWLIVHPEAAAEGLYTGLVGENIDVAALIKA
jgi:hypothetical protein